jgi:hypothetical protein
MKRWLKRLMWLGLAGLMLLVVAAAASFLSNLSLPTHSQIVDKLSPLEEAHLREVFRLRQAVGEQVSPGFATANIPVIVYNEKNAFLVGYQNPPPGWLKVPQRTAYGRPWTPVAGDTFFGQTYYFQQLEPGQTPQSFTVLVGDQWVATLQTREYAEIYLYSEFRKAVPRFARSILPYRLIWRTLMGETDQYIAGLEHECFHAFEGVSVPTRLADAENAVQLEGRYPWGHAGSNRMWEAETGSLVRAIQAASDDEARNLARQFLDQRDARRKAGGLAADLVDYERQREWLEGLAKYAEVSIGRAVAATPGYHACEELKADADFKNYSTRSRYWSRQLNEVPRLLGHSDEKRFYYSGMAQAILLDRLSPSWKQRAFSPTVFQETLLRDAVVRSGT